MIFRYLAGFAAVLIISCSSPTLQEQLELLKVEKADLDGRIKDLEDSITKFGADSTIANLRSVSITELKPVLFKSYVEIQGQVDADENITLSAEIGGQVTRIIVKTGQEVSKGQLLAETDSKIILQGMAELQNALDLAKIMFEKQKNLWDQKIGTEIQYLAAKNQKESLEKKMSTLQEQLELTKITSPIAGTVDGVHIKVGQMLGPGMPAITVVNFSSLKVKGNVPESYAGSIKKGNDVMILFPDINDSVSSKVEYAARVINTLNRTFTVEILLGENKTYHPNMIAVMKINNYTSEKPVITIPTSTILRDETGKDFVMVIENGLTKKVFIRTGKKYNSRAEVLEGLKENDKLVSKGFQDLNEGEKVNY